MFGIVLSTLLVLGSTLSAGTVLKVSPTGELKTPAAALAKARELRSGGRIARDERVVIELEAGVYELEEPLRVGKEDGPVEFRGTAGGPTSVSAALTGVISGGPTSVSAAPAGGSAGQRGRDEARPSHGSVPPGPQAVLSGGRRLGAFTAGADGIWRAKVPEGFVFEQLYVNGRRAQPAREPNEGWHYILKEYGEGVNPVTGKMENLALRMINTDPKLVKMLEGLDAEELAAARLHVWWSWDTEWGRPVHADAAKGEILLKGPLARSVFFWSGYCTRVNLENCRAALDAPGEWFLDRRRGEVLYIPRPGELPETTVAVAPRLRNVVLVEDADGVVFRNLVFAHNGWLMPANGFYEHQSSAYGDAAVVTAFSRHVDFIDCTVEHTADYGLWFDAGTEDSRIVHCYLHDLGAGGIRVGPYGSRSKNNNSSLPENYVRRVLVDDNILHDGGHVMPAGTGIFITRMSDSTVTHNEVCDFFYSGITCGYSWSYRNQQNFNNTLSWNHIHHLGKGQLSDMGFIYTLGDSRGTVVTGNHGHDILSYGYTGSGGTGLYPDEGSEGILWTSNLVHHTRTSCLSQHYGRDNRFLNNIFAFPSKPGASAGGRWRPENHVSLVVSNNVFVWSKGLRGWRSAQSERPGRVDDLVFGNNLWWSVDGVADNDFNCLSFAEWQQQGGGFDLGSKVADPKFVDWRRGDWHLRDDSPAIGLGFVPWDYTFAGVRDRDPAWRAKAAAIRCAEFKLPKAPPKNPEVNVFSTSFEGFGIGETPQGAIGAWSFGPQAGVKKVTDRDHRRGGKCLELTDGEAVKPGFEPHVFKALKLAGTEFVLKFSFKSDERAYFAAELRDNGNPKATNGAYSTAGTLLVEKGKLGLVVRVNEGGKLVGRRFEFANYASGKWMDVVMTFHTPGNTTPTFDVEVTNEDGERAEYRDLYFHDAASRVPNWIGFISWSTWPTTTFLDDFGYECR